MSQESDAVVLVVSEETGDVVDRRARAVDPQAHARRPARPAQRLLGRGDATQPLRKAAVLIPLLMMFHG
jgi:hypothetical protein